MGNELKNRKLIGTRQVVNISEICKHSEKNFKASENNSKVSNFHDSPEMLGVDVLQVPAA